MGLRFLPRRLVALALGVSPLAVAVAAESLHHRADQSPGTEAAVTLGQQTFAMCAACHGADGEGKVGVAPRLNSANYLAAAPNDFFRKTLLTGRAGTNMMALGKNLTPEQLDGLVAYIRSWQSTPSVELNEAPLKGDVATGEQLYSTICARCHGRSGAGYSEAGSGTGIGREDFLNVASDGFLRAVLRHGKDNTPMRPFSDQSPVSVANLSDAELDSIIQYLRANAW